MLDQIQLSYTRRTRARLAKHTKQQRRDAVSSTVCTRHHIKPFGRETKCLVRRFGRDRRNHFKILKLAQETLPRTMSRTLAWPVARVSYRKRYRERYCCDTDQLVVTYYILYICATYCSALRYHVTPGTFAIASCSYPQGEGEKSSVSPQEPCVQSRSKMWRERHKTSFSHGSPRYL